MRICFTVTIFLLSTSLIFAAMPPETIESLNSQAEEIMIGEVLEINNAPAQWCAGERLPEESLCKYFLLRVEHVVKSKNRVREGGLVKVRFVEYLTPIRGPRLIKVEVGKIIIIYANQLHFDEDVLVPVAAGDSVIKIGLPSM